MVDASSSGLGLSTRNGRRREADQGLGRFVRVERWNGMAAGDVVRVSGHTARGRHWRFKAHVTNSSNGASWVEVSLVEGPPPPRRGSLVPDGTDRPAPVRVERVRSFAPELVSPRYRRRFRSRTTRDDPAVPTLF